MVSYVPFPSTTIRTARIHQPKSKRMVEMKFILSCNRKVFYDKEGNTFIVWFSDPKEEYICEETGEEVVLMKDKSGRTKLLTDRIHRLRS
jgi:hypothetical protein